MKRKQFPFPNFTYMSRSHQILLLCLLYSSNLFSQVNHTKDFNLHGKINADTGTVTLVQIVSAEYYLGGEKKMVSRIIDNSFSFKGILTNPLAFKIIYNDTYYSDLFVVEQGDQEIIVDIKSTEKTPVVLNATMEKQRNFVAAFSELKQKNKLSDSKFDSLKILHKGNLPENMKLELDNEIKTSYKENDKVLLKFVQDHPDSYLAFWKLIYLNLFGYETIFDSIFNAFNKDLQTSYSGKILSANLAIGRRLAIGTKFPNFPVVDTKNKPIETNFLSKKYTLIDFWYSNCGPCIAQFEDLKKTYGKYHDQGFEIVGVSTDKIKYKRDWLNAIKIHSLPWRQYWDIDGLEATKLSIVAFPTNFLIDNNGKIIQKNITPAQLEEFLRKNSLIR